MKKWPKIRRLARVQFKPDEFLGCIKSVEEASRRYGRSEKTRLELIGGFWQDEEKALAFTARMACMIEVMKAPEIAEYSTIDSASNLAVTPVGQFHAAALSELHFDDDNQYFDVDEFLAILKLEDAMLAQTAYNVNAL